jgi:hypothetical protein
VSPLPPPPTHPVQESPPPLPDPPASEVIPPPPSQSGQNVLRPEPAADQFNQGADSSNRGADSPNRGDNSSNRATDSSAQVADWPDWSGTNQGSTPASAESRVVATGGALPCGSNETSCGVQPAFDLCENRLSDPAGDDGILFHDFLP